MIIQTECGPLFKDDVSNDELKAIKIVKTIEGDVIMLNYLNNLYIAKQMFEAGKGKLQEDENLLKMFEEFGYSKEFMKIIGGVETTGAALLALSLFNKKFNQAGALLVGGVMVGAIYSHLKAGQGYEATKNARNILALNTTSFLASLKDDK
ncbi:DoxX family protein [Macrococcoides canis]|nr:DoxX family protein [Macrococcus canis]QHW12346.1 DoxX-like family protein [Macrococcus canis]